MCIYIYTTYIYIYYMYTGSHKTYLFVGQKCYCQFFSWTKQVLLHRVFFALILCIGAYLYLTVLVWTPNISHKCYVFELNGASWKKATFSKGMLLYLLKRNAVVSKGYWILWIKLNQYICWKKLLLSIRFKSSKQCYFPGLLMASWCKYIYIYRFAIFI